MTVNHRSEDATALVGMAGIVIGVQELIDGEWWLHAETRVDVTGCSGCGTRAVGHGRTRSQVRDLSIAGRPVVLVFARRRWRCPEPACAINTWSESHDQIPFRGSLTARAREQIAGMVNNRDFSVAAAAAEFGVGWHTANGAVVEHTDPVVEDPARLQGVSSIGVDAEDFPGLVVEVECDQFGDLKDIRRAGSLHGQVVGEYGLDGRTAGARYTIFDIMVSWMPPRSHVRSGTTLG